MIKKIDNKIKTISKKINKEYADKMSSIEEKYNQQSVPIATNLLKLDKSKIDKILDEDPKNISSLNNKGYALSKLKDFSAASVLTVVSRVVV